MFMAGSTLGDQNVLEQHFEETAMPNKKHRRKERERTERPAATEGAGAGFDGWNIEFNDQLGFGSLVITASDSDEVEFQGFSSLPPQQTPSPPMFEGEDASNMTCPVPSNALFHTEVRDGTLLFAITFVWTATATGSDDVVQTVYVGMPVHQAAVDMALPEEQYTEAMKRAIKMLYEEEFELFVKVVACTFSWLDHNSHAVMFVVCRLCTTAANFGLRCAIC
jgi:hypothetical protein